MTQSRTLPAGDVFRAPLVLMLGKGLSYRTIQQRLDTTAPTFARWRHRFVKQRIAGLPEIRHPGQKPSVITPSLQAKVLETTRRTPSDGCTHWSCRKLGTHMKISKDTVQRIWPKPGLKPHRLERNMASDDPNCERKAADVSALYLSPPQHAAVFCVVEKSAIQARDRLDPVLPISLAASIVTASNTTGMGGFRCLQLCMCGQERCRGSRRRGMPARSSLVCWIGLSAAVNRTRKSTSCSTTCPPTRPPTCRRFNRTSARSPALYAHAFFVAESG